MAFRLNKLRDFYLVLNKIMSNRSSKLDAVDSVLLDKRNVGKPNSESMALVNKIVALIIKEDRKKLLEVIRNLNTKA